jgi:hypothetical protein
MVDYAYRFPQLSVKVVHDPSVPSPAFRPASPQIAIRLREGEPVTLTADEVRKLADVLLQAAAAADRAYAERGARRRPKPASPS